MAKKDYKNWDKNDLIKEIEQLRKRKKYGLVWEDKPENVVEQCKTELPVLEEIKSKEIITDPDKPMNLLIEGDNYHALSVLNYTHKGKIDVIYIDPPYNTGNKDFVYNDQYVDKEDGYRHSKWLSFMEKRLKLAKKLLKNTGVIFISIDDNEFAQLKVLCDSIFNGNSKTKDNFIGCLPTIMNLKGNNDDFGFSGTHEYTLVYAKNKSYCNINHFNLDEDELSNWDEDDYGLYKKADTLRRTGQDAPRERRPKGWFPVFISLKDNKIYVTDNNRPINKNDIVLYPINSRGEEMSWSWGKQKITKESYNLIITGDSKKGFNIYKKQRPQLGDIPTKKPKTIFYKPEYSNSTSTNKLKEMFGEKVFDTPKPVELLKDFIYLGGNKNSIILDFMAGSGTTGQAVMELNEEDNGNRKFILCTNNELNGIGSNLASEKSDENQNKFGVCQRATYPRLNKVILGYKKNGNGAFVNGLNNNLKYYKTTFVSADLTDTNKTKLTKKATEMLCVKEDTFEKVKSTAKYKIFRNKKKYTGIIYDHLAIDDFKKEIAKIDGKFSVYVFSLGDDTFDEEFEDVKNKVKLSPIPEAILRVYRRIFK